MITSIAKRVFDVLGAALLLVLLLPLFVLVSIAIKLDSRGPLLYRSQRVGSQGRTFHMLKFRKMRDDASGSPLTARRDERFTRVGSFLARTKLDELPQLWNVLRGHMSLVGPRPEDPIFVDLYRDHFTAILSMRPGITGLSQLAFAKESYVLDTLEGPDPMVQYTERLLPQKLGLDRLYVTNRSMRGDIRILVWTTVAVLINLNVSVDRRDGRLTVRRRPRRLRVAVPSEVSVVSEESGS